VWDILNSFIRPFAPIKKSVTERGKDLIFKGFVVTITDRKVPHAQGDFRGWIILNDLYMYRMHTMTIVLENPDY
jgi:hypothetical protein